MTQEQELISVTAHAFVSLSMQFQNPQQIFTNFIE